MDGAECDEYVSHLGRERRPVFQLSNLFQFAGTSLKVTIRILIHNVCQTYAERQVPLLSVSRQQSVNDSRATFAPAVLVPTNRDIRTEYHVRH